MVSFKNKAAAVQLTSLETAGNWNSSEILNGLPDVQMKKSYNIHLLFLGSFQSHVF